MLKVFFLFVSIFFLVASIIIDDYKGKLGMAYLACGFFALSSVVGDLIKDDE